MVLPIPMTILYQSMPVGTREIQCEQEALFIRCLFSTKMGILLALLVNPLPVVIRDSDGHKEVLIISTYLGEQEIPEKIFPFDCDKIELMHAAIRKSNTVEQVEFSDL
jgi:hypothetical protein